MNQGQWGLVLSGGGAKGAYEIGVWQAMKELQMENWIGGISGASIGSLNATLFIGSDYEHAAKAWSEVDPLTVFDIDLELIDGREGTFSRDGLLDLIHRYIDMDKLKRSDIPIYCSVAEPKPDGRFQCEYLALQGKTAYSIEQILIASSAMPIIYEDVEYGGKQYRDGGLCDNFPIKPLYGDGFRKMILIGLQKEQKQLEANYPDVEFLSVYPSHDLGGLVDGTLNFQQSFIDFARRLGYKDGMRIFKAYLDGTLASKSELEMQQLADLDYTEIKVDMTKQQLQNSVDEHMDYLNGILNRYGI